MPEDIVNSSMFKSTFCAFATSALLLAPMGRLSKVILNSGTKSALSGIVSKVIKPANKQTSGWLSSLIW